MIVLLASRPDPASVNIRDRLLEDDGWEQGPLFMGRRTHSRGIGAMDLVLAETPLLHLEADGIDRLLAQALGSAPDAIVVLSKHQAASGKPSFTVHPVGNFSEAKFGGKPGTLGIAAPVIQSTLLRLLAEEAKGMKHDVTFEATHHGPLLATPCAFVEIGSSKEEWVREENARVVARALLRLDDESLTPTAPVLVGLGGGHYVPRMTDLARSRCAEFGHLVPQYALEAGLPRSMFEQVVLRTPDVEGYFVDPRLEDAAVAEARSVFDELGLVRHDEASLRGPS